MRQRASTLGRIPPLFWGGSLSSFSTCAPGTQGEGRFTGDNHSGMREIKESGSAAFLDLSGEHPPPDSVPSIIDHCYIKKQPNFRFSQPISF